MGDADNLCFIEGPADDLEPDRQACFGKAAWYADGPLAGQGQRVMLRLQASVSDILTEPSVTSVSPALGAVMGRVGVIRASTFSKKRTFHQQRNTCTSRGGRGWVFDGFMKIALLPPPD
jgi:hypothetical protein